MGLSGFSFSAKVGTNGLIALVVNHRGAGNVRRSLPDVPYEPILREDCLTSKLKRAFQVSTVR